MFYNTYLLLNTTMLFRFYTKIILLKRWETHDFVYFIIIIKDFFMLCIPQVLHMQWATAPHGKSISLFMYSTYTKQTMYRNMCFIYFGRQKSSTLFQFILTCSMHIKINWEFWIKRIFLFMYVQYITYVYCTEKNWKWMKLNWIIWLV